MAAPFVPAAVVDGNVLPAHGAGVHEGFRRAPAGAAVERNVLLRQDIPRLPHGSDVIGAAHGAIRIVEIFHVGRVATRMAPARTGNVTFWLDITVAAGFTDKLWPGTNAHQGCILTVQHSPGLFHIHHQPGLARDRRAKIRGWLHVLRRSALNGQAGI